MKALITGITGQDGHYLTELLLSKGYEVYGLVRSTNQTIGGVEVIYGDVTDPPALPMVDEVYNLAAMSHVGESFHSPCYTFDVNATGAVRMLKYAYAIGAKFYQASTSELFGNSSPPQTIDSPMNPVSPYGVSKLAAHKQVEVMRKLGAYACTGVLFNHESPYRGENFVTQKICRGVQDIAAGESNQLRLGNVEAKRDWGHAKDYVRGMWQIMQQEDPGDYLLATGQAHSVLDWVTLAFQMMDLNYKDYVVIDPEFYRPNDVNYLCGQSNATFWKPTITFENLVWEMVHAIPADL
jgi:GDPmannose 4,6-dehydratase